MDVLLAKINDMRNEDIFKVCFSQLRGLSQLVGLAYGYIFVFPVG